MTNCAREPNKHIISLCEIYGFSLFGWRATRGCEICLLHSSILARSPCASRIPEIYKIYDAYVIFSSCTLIAVNQNFRSHLLVLLISNDGADVHMAAYGAETRNRIHCSVYHSKQIKWNKNKSIWFKHTNVPALLLFRFVSFRTGARFELRPPSGIKIYRIPLRQGQPAPRKSQPECANQK